MSEKGDRLNLARMPQVYEHPPCAAGVLRDAIGVDEEVALRGLRALLLAGFYIGPIEPTNSMLRAYLHALPPAPSKSEAVLSAIGKARRRWKAMAEAGNCVAMSLANN